MPGILRLFSTAATRGKHRFLAPFASAQSRFRLAVSTGFVVAAVGFLVAGAETKYGVAQDVFGFFGMRTPGEAPPASYAAAPDAGDPAARRHRRHAHKSSRSHEGRSHDHLHFASDRGGAPLGLARKSMCVRLCDGFAFPVGNFYGEGDRVAHEAACQSECPGARTALYVLPGGSDTMADATQAKTGQAYSKMPDAFRYTTFVDEACSCHPQGRRSASALLRDFTLRRGDAVMTPKGLQVFHGGAGYPFKPRDFVALGKSRDVRQADRNGLKAIERASLILPTTVVSAPPRARPAAISRTTTKGLQHQARN